MAKAKAKATVAVPAVGENGEPVAPKFPTITTKLFLGDKALDANDAKDILGWEEETEEKKFPDDEVILVLGGKKIRTANNLTNRPFNRSLADTYAQDILNRNWADSRNGEDMSINGETIVRDRTGMVQSGQHRLIGLILAHHRFEDAKEKEHWAAKWPNAAGPSIEAILVSGISPNQRVIRTLDNVKTRTLDDVLYTSGAFGKLKSSDRKVINKIAAFAVKNLWERLGAKNDPFSPDRTHSESMEFLDRHPRVYRAVKHIWEEDADGKIKAFVSPGTAAALLYLMGASTSDGAKYHEAEQPSENYITWGSEDATWDKAQEFWTLMKESNEDYKPLRDAIGMLTDPNTGREGTRDEKVAIIIKAWNLISNGQPLTADGLKLEYTQPAPDEPARLAEVPTVAGIDLGKPKPPVDPDAPTEEEKAAKKAEIQAKKDAKKAKKDGADPGQGTPEILQEVHKVEKLFPDRLLLFKGQTTWNAFGEHAKPVGKATGEKVGKRADGVDRCSFPLEKLDEHADRLKIFSPYGGNVMTVEWVDAVEQEDGTMKEGYYNTFDLPKKKLSAMMDEPLADEGEVVVPTEEELAAAQAELEAAQAKKPLPKPKQPALRGGTNN